MWRGASGSVRHTTKHQSAPLGVGGPDLLARDDPVVAVEDRLGLDVGEVRAGVGLGVALAPQLGPPPDGVEEAVLLLVGAVGDQGRAQQALAHHVDAGRGVGPDVLLVPDHLLGHRGAAAAVLDGPAHTSPSLESEPALPREAEVAALVLQPGPAQPPGLGEVPRQVGLEPAPSLGSEGGVLGAVVEVHGWFSRACSQARSVSGVTLAKGS